MDRQGTGFLFWFWFAFLFLFLFLTILDFRSQGSKADRPIYYSLLHNWRWWLQALQDIGLFNVLKTDALFYGFEILKPNAYS